MYTTKGHILNFNLSHLIIWYIYKHNVALKLFFSWGQVKLSKAAVRLHTNTVSYVYTPSWGKRPAVASAAGSNQLSGLS